MATIPLGQDFTMLVQRRGDGFVFPARSETFYCSPDHAAKLVAHLQRALGHSGPVLMSGDNHNGWKLEDLCEQLIREVAAKNEGVIRRGSHLAGAGEQVVRNNRTILELLNRIRSTQQDTLRALSEVGPDLGPASKPRI